MLALHKLILAAIAAAPLLYRPAIAGQVPGAAGAPDIPITSQDRVYMSDQTSNTVSVVDPATETLLGVIRLGDPLPGSLNPRYKAQLLVHGMGFSPDHRTLVVVSTASNSVAFIDTQTNLLKQVDYVGRAPHEAMFTPDGKEVWVTIRGEDYVQVIDGRTLQPVDRIDVANGPGMTIFRLTAAMGTSARASVRKPTSSTRRVTGLSHASGRHRRFARISRRHRTARRSG